MEANESSERRETAPVEQPPEKPAAKANPANPVRRWTLIALATGAVLLIYHLIADFLTPYTSQAHVQAFVVDIAPEVSGSIVEVAVKDNALVVAGQPLFRVDPIRFRIAVETAEAKLAQAGQTIGASTSGIASAEARASAAQAHLENMRKQTARARELVEKGVYSQAKGDEAEAQLSTAQADVHRARADVESARKQLGSR